MNHFFDVGANIGQTFDDFLTKTTEFDGWDIWCFEPSPRHVPKLMEKVKGLTSRYRIHVCPFGLRGDSKVQPFFQKDDLLGDSFESYLASDHLTHNLNEGYLLHVSSWNAAEFILNQTQPGDSIFLKLDCEGSEFDLLSHLIGSPEALVRIHRIMVEWHHIKSAVPTRSIQELHLLYMAIEKPLERWMY